DIGLRPDRPRERVPPRRATRLFRGQLTAAYGLRDERVVPRDLLDRRTLDPVGPTVPHVRHVVLAVLEQQRDDRSAHALEVRPAPAFREHRRVRRADRLPQADPGIHRGHQDLERAVRRNLASRVTAHPIRHREQRPAIGPLPHHDCILVGWAPAAIRVVRRRRDRPRRHAQRSRYTNVTSPISMRSPSRSVRLSPSPASSTPFTTSGFVREWLVMCQWPSAYRIRAWRRLTVGTRSCTWTGGFPGLRPNVT